MANGLMAGKRGLIMGLANDKSIAWGIAKACADQGAELAFSYQGEALKKRVEPLAASIGMTEMIECDVASGASLDALFAHLQQIWGHLDFVVHAIGFSDKNELRGRYVDTCAANFRMTMDISVYSFTAVCQRAEAMMADGRQPADADLLRRGKGDAALQRHGRGQGGAGGIGEYIWPRIWARMASG